MNSLFSINQLTYQRVGREQTDVLVLDEFLIDLDAVRQQALEAGAFGPDGVTAYPGVRSDFPREWSAGIVEVLNPLLRKSYKIPLNLKPTVALAYFSLLTTPASKLKIQQCMPHIDTSRQYYYAILLYLNNGDFGGTGFFCHRPTGFERITEEKRPIYNQSSLAFMAARGLPEPQYIAGSNQHYEMIGQVDYRKNRLAVYPGNLLHSALVDESRDLGDDPATKRLTANIFIEYK